MATHRQSCIPGYFQAVDLEQQLRAEAYLGNPSVCAGVRVHQMTPRSYNLLMVLDSPWVNGGEIGAAAAIQFLFTLSIDFKDFGLPWFVSHYAKFIRKKGYDWEYVCDCIGEFVETTFLDAPTGKETTPYACSTAWLELHMYKLMGWHSDRTLDTPLRRIYQLLRCEAMEAGDKTLVNKLSDAKKDEWLRAVNNWEITLN